MPFYRKLKIDNKDYEFHVGKHFVKIKGIEGNSNIQKKDFFQDYRGSDGDLVQNYAVSPGMVADYINGNNIRDIKLKRPTPTCGCNKPLTEKHWRCDPFDAEVHGDYHYAMWCEECHERRSWDI